MMKILIGIAVVVVLAAAYIFFFQGWTTPTTQTVTTTATSAVSEIDATGAALVADNAEGATSEIASEISSGDNLEVPGVNE